VFRARQLRPQRFTPTQAANVNEHPEPDWYADPTGIHHHRYWDGERWTARVADRFGATSAHHLQDRYAPPGHERVEPVVASASVDLGGTTEAATHAPSDDIPDDALTLAAQVLEGACERSGFSWRDSDMTIDDAINALPVDIADNTVGMMNRLFVAAADDENAAWTATKLREIKLLKRGYRQLHELVTSTPKDELFERSRRFGVPDDLTEDFVAGVLSSEIPTVAELQTAQLPVGGPDAA
jgi:hypothetical protein